MSKTQKDAPVLDGTVLSEQLTNIGKQIQVYFEYAGKIARVSSEQMTMIKNEKPAGLELFLQEIEKEELRRDRKLKPEEKKELERSVRYTIQPKKIGNVDPMFRTVLNEIITDNKHWQDLIGEAKKEVALICSKKGAIENAVNFDVRDGL